LIFAVFGSSARSKNELRQNGWRYRLTVCEQELLYSFRTSRELYAHISCLD